MRANCLLFCDRNVTWSIISFSGICLNKAGHIQTNFGPLILRDVFSTLLINLTSSPITKFLIESGMTSEFTVCSWCNGFHSTARRHCVLYLMHRHLINDAVYQEGHMRLISNLYLIKRCAYLPMYYYLSHDCFTIYKTLKM